MGSFPSTVAPVAGARASLAETVDAFALDCFLLSDCCFFFLLFENSFLQLRGMRGHVSRHFASCLSSYSFSFDCLLDSLAFFLDDLCNVGLLEDEDWQASHLQCADHSEVSAVLIDQLIFLKFQLCVQ